MKGNAQHRQAHAADQQHEPGVCHDPAGLGKIFLSPGDGAQRRTAHAEQVGKGCDQRHDGKADPQPRQGQSALPGEFADINAVHDVVQQVQHLGDEHGGGDGKNVLPDAAGGKIHLLAMVRGPGAV